jgi:hypothetical protein
LQISYSTENELVNVAVSSALFVSDSRRAIVKVGVGEYRQIGFARSKSHEDRALANLALLGKN